jgi:hypothetical protein
MLFWDVDTQVDFMMPGGSLHIAGAEKIIRSLPLGRRLIAFHLSPRLVLISPAIQNSRSMDRIAWPGRLASKKCLRRFCPNGMLSRIELSRFLTSVCFSR